MSESPRKELLLSLMVVRASVDPEAITSVICNRGMGGGTIYFSGGKIEIDNYNLANVEKSYMEFIKYKQDRNNEMHSLLTSIKYRVDDLHKKIEEVSNAVKDYKKR